LRVRPRTVEWSPERSAIRSSIVCEDLSAGDAGIYLNIETVGCRAGGGRERGREASKHDNASTPFGRSIKLQKRMCQGQRG
jgi:hypothetical protein